MAANQKVAVITGASQGLVGNANSNVPSVLASITKGGVDAATRSLAIEYATRGIRVNAVAPGIIKTPMHEPQTHAALAGFVTGETLHVYGGQSAGH